MDNSIVLPLFETCIAMGGRATKQISPKDYILHITQNSKDIREGSLFIAIKGNRVDGHDFVRNAEEKGAIAALVEREVKGVNLLQIIVPSSREAMGTLGKIWRCRFDIPLIAVTGSVGKTTTKELIHHVLSAQYNTHKSRRNYNNEIGVPLELLRLNRKHECSVIELGMRGQAQISYLSKIARPSIGVITNIGMSHIEMLKSRENIALAKLEISEGMDLDSLMIINRDDDFYELLRSKIKSRVITFGEHEESDIRISSIQLSDKAHPSFRLNGFPIIMEKAVGKHHAYNAAIAYAVGLQIGMKQEDISSKLESFETPDKRGSVTYLKNGAILLDSSYNAAPDSIKASLYTVSELAQRGKNVIAVIGEMLELGSYSKEAHTHIGQVLSDMPGRIDSLITVGEYARFIGEAGNINNWEHFSNSTLASNHLKDHVKEGDIILVQGSNSISLDLVIETLENEFGVVR